MGMALLARPKTVRRNIEVDPEVVSAGRTGETRRFDLGRGAMRFWCSWWREARVVFVERRDMACWCAHKSCK